MEKRRSTNGGRGTVGWPTSARILPVALLAAGCMLASAQPAGGGGKKPGASAPALSHPLAPAATGTAAPKGPPPPAAAAKARTIEWDELVPPGWDPLKDFKAAEFGAMNDGDPRAAALLKRMREAWDQAPVNDALDGAQVRIPGYVVPLEEGPAGTVKEFLLVPYFGACIHSPPPPANQIIHVQAGQAAKGLRSMDAVWVSGRLEAFRGDSFMGVSGYRMRGPLVEPYVEKKAR